MQLNSRDFATLAAALVLCGACAAWGAEAGAELANGVLLVAQPGLQDPNFRETVVLITQPQPGGGPLGVIINRPTERRLREVFAENPALQSLDDRLYAGGPVARSTLMFVFRAPQPPEASLHVLEDIYLSASAELLAALLKRPQPTESLRVYAGYAGWAPGQLQMEIALGGWVLLKADPSIIFARDPSSLWRELIGRAAQRRTDLPAPADAVARTAD